MWSRYTLALNKTKANYFKLLEDLEEHGAQEVRCKVRGPKNKNIYYCISIQAKYASGKEMPELQGESSQSFQRALDRLRPKVNEELERLSEKI